MNKLLHELAERATEEHPDTIALRECRKQLESEREEVELKQACIAAQSRQLESAQRLLDQRGQDIEQYKERSYQAESERDTARAALKAANDESAWDEAESKVKQLEDRLSLCVDGRVYDACVRDLHALQAKLARAVALLESASSVAVIAEALEALK